MTAAWVFPGQGVQRPGMAVDLADAHPAAAEVFAVASDTLGFDVLELCRSGPEARLNDTEVAQPALLTASVACLAAARPCLPCPAVIAGHSLGEYSALVASGALALPDAVAVVRERGRLMAAATAGRDVTMAAIIGMEAAAVESLCTVYDGTGVVVPSAYNSPRQTVVGGHRAAVDAVIAGARAQGGDAVALRVSSAFHTPLMAPAVAGLAAVIDAVDIAPPCCPVVPNASATPTTSPDELRRQLVRQLDRPVRWAETTTALRRLGVRTVIELGPGRVLAGLARKTDRRLQVHAVEDLASLAATGEALAGARSLAGART